MREERKGRRRRSGEGEGGRRRRGREEEWGGEGGRRSGERIRIHTYVHVLLVVSHTYPHT